MYLTETKCNKSIEHFVAEELWWKLPVEDFISKLLESAVAKIYLENELKNIYASPVVADLPAGEVVGEGT